MSNKKVKFSNKKNRTLKKSLYKKNNKISSNKVLLTNELSDVEKRYCSCLMKVRKTKFNPYAICTDSVYNKQGLTRSKVINCGKYYDFSKYTVPMLKFFLKEKKIRGISKLNKKQLLSLLKRYQIQKNKLINISKTS
tara:strand:- start:60 stop:470 length:411 start_codon:yes stop_codon:yes gene_type:complete